jgi:hypothetical protein
MSTCCLSYRSHGGLEQVIALVRLIEHPQRVSGAEQDRHIERQVELRDYLGGNQTRALNAASDACNETTHALDIDDLRNLLPMLRSERCAVGASAS